MSTLRTLGIALASAATAASLTITGQAVADHDHHGGSDGHSHAGAVPAPPTQPTRDDQIQNIDQVKTAIKAYYGDTLTTTPDPVTGATTLHTFDPNGAYAQQMQGLEHEAAKYLAKRARHGTAPKDAVGHGDRARRRSCSTSTTPRSTPTTTRSTRTSSTTRRPTAPSSTPRPSRRCRG